MRSAHENGRSMLRRVQVLGDRFCLAILDKDINTFSVIYYDPIRFHSLKWWVCMPLPSQGNHSIVRVSGVSVMVPAMKRNHEKQMLRFDVPESTPLPIQLLLEPCELFVRKNGLQKNPSAGNE